MKETVMIRRLKKRAGPTSEAASIRIAIRADSNRS